MTNRVDELESQVAKLQATVDGLTEELVETKERVRLLEESVDVDLSTGSRAVGYDPNSGSDAGADGRADAAPETGAGAGNDSLTESRAQMASRSQTTGTKSNDVDFINAEGDNPIPSEAAADGATDGDETKTEGAEGDDDATTEDDDIIVA
ncbi:hypothetical protein GCM10008995_07960 [Halobellus salinus]|uniref:BZIP transcription factor n=1 Tax=Halobellus salinus TaxID=931585 RepID=A0A830E8I4_9EURY|nr:hypothetical protein [Halobellus salinus]GGJ00547.1 hypothetical protein GCM10008995_07960 [Halobellus salinus]SMP01454.1 hypothetical protein SAMN06265347_101112 [Halobellus salinus]